MYHVQKKIKSIEKISSNTLICLLKEEKEYAHIYTQLVVLERIKALQRVTLQNKKKPLRS